MIAAGPDSRLLRAVLEPWCPVPFVAWPGPALPGWAGSLDLVVVLAPDGSDTGTASAVAEAVRRGCQVVVACPPSSMVAEHAAGRWSTILPTATRDQLATAVVMLAYLDRVPLGPARRRRAGRRGPRRRRDRLLAAPRPRRQPGQDAGHRAGRRQPARLGRLRARRPGRAPGRRVDPPRERPDRAGRRRRAPAAGASRRPGRGTSSTTRSPTAPPEARPMLLVLDDGAEEPVVREQRGRLQAAAAARGVRVETRDAPRRRPRWRATRRSCSAAPTPRSTSGIGLVEE